MITVCPHCQSPRCPELLGTGACPADYARSLPVLIDGVIYYPPDKPRTRDWPAFWRTLSDAECAAALRAAPRVAGEWEPVPGSTNGYAFKHSIGRVDALAMTWQREDGRWSASALSREFPSRFPSERAARSACDAALRAAGWRVL